MTDLELKEELVDSNNVEKNFMQSSSLQFKCVCLTKQNRISIFGR